MSIFVTKKNKLHNDPSLKLDGSETPIVDKHKFLGMIFDKKLTFIPHLKYLKTKCNKTLQLLCVVAHKEWGADWKTLWLLYRLLIRSLLDYGNFIYQSARKSYVKTLDPIYHGDLRFILRVFRTSPAKSLYVEANETPANIRSHKMALQYHVKLESCPTNPVHFLCKIRRTISKERKKPWNPLVSGWKQSLEK